MSHDEEQLRKKHKRFLRVSKIANYGIITPLACLVAAWTALTAYTTPQKAERDRQPVIDIDISALRIHPEGKGYFLDVTVTLHNIGLRNTYISWENAVPLTVRRQLRWDGTGGKEEIRYEDPKQPGLLLLSGATTHLPYWVPVDSPGYYLIEFQADVDATDVRSSLKDFAPRLGTSVVWRDVRMFAVEP